MALQTEIVSASGKSATINNYTYALIVTHDSYDSAANSSQVTVKAYILCPDSGSGTIFYFIDCTASCTINGTAIGGIVKNCECYYNTSLNSLPSKPLWSRTVTLPHNSVTKKLTLDISGSFTHSSSDKWMPPALSFSHEFTLDNPASGITSIPIVFNGQEVKSVVFNGQTVEHLVYNGKTVF